MQDPGHQTGVRVNQKVTQNQTGTLGVVERLGYVNPQPRGVMIT